MQTDVCSHRSWTSSRKTITSPGLPFVDPEIINLGYLQNILGGDFKYFLCSYRILGEMIQFDEHIFQMGWFNHQLVLGFMLLFQDVRQLHVASLSPSEQGNAEVTWVCQGWNLVTNC